MTQKVSYNNPQNLKFSNWQWNNWTFKIQTCTKAFIWDPLTFVVRKYRCYMCYVSPAHVKYSEGLWKVHAVICNSLDNHWALKGWGVYRLNICYTWKLDFCIFLGLSSSMDVCQMKISPPGESDDTMVHVKVPGPTLTFQNITYCVRENRGLCRKRGPEKEILKNVR